MRRSSARRSRRRSPSASVSLERARRARRQRRTPLGGLSERLPRRGRTIVSWVLTLAAAVLLVLALKTWVAGPYRISSSSMEPTFHCGKGPAGCTARFSDRVLVNRIGYRFGDPHRGDVVAFHAPRRAERVCGVGGTLVARIVGLPGERVAERDGRMFVDGKPLEEPYASTHTAGEDGRWGPLGEHAYFLMGDNRVQSCDSRRWGPVDRGDLQGTVFFVYWPPKRIAFR